MRSPGQASAGLRRRGEQLGRSEDEIAFYGALEVNDSAVKVLGAETLHAAA
jgi:type I restriction enzyme R subunit